MKNNKLLELGHKIRLERMKRDISQEKLAEIANLSRRALSCIECGVNDPKYTTLLQIAEAFNMKISDLLDFKM